MTVVTDLLRSISRRRDNAQSSSSLWSVSTEKRMLADLQNVITPSISQTEAAYRAEAIIVWYEAASKAERLAWMHLLCRSFSPSALEIQPAIDAFERSLGTGAQGVAEIQLRKTLASPRRRLLRAMSAAPNGMRFLVDMRAELLRLLPQHPEIKVLDAEIENLFISWFDVAFLELKRISWDSPASMLEKLIQYEAVHDIASWEDLKNRLDADRRCYGFFHPRLPNEPLIFVEVAFTDSFDHPAAQSIAPLLDITAAATDLKSATTAIFYSISNTQVGLKGVGFGDSLIKQVVETLKSDLPNLKIFTTLSPIPGFSRWLEKNQLQLHNQARGTAIFNLNEKSAVRKSIKQAAAQYLLAVNTSATEASSQHPIDPVARFHLTNGAKVERLNWAANSSAKGIEQSYGLMVNYLYDLRSLDKNRGLLSKGRVAVAREVSKLI